MVPANARGLRVITARDIIVNANLTGGSGGLSLSANQQATPKNANFVGVTVQSGAVVSATGAVTVSGTGGSASGSDNYGVKVRDTNSSITSASNNVTGQGGGSSGAGSKPSSSLSAVTMPPSKEGAAPFGQLQENLRDYR